jgi:hypothetical protein
VSPHEILAYILLAVIVLDALYHRWKRKRSD